MPNVYVAVVQQPSTDDWQNDGDQSSGAKDLVLAHGRDLWLE